MAHARIPAMRAETETTAANVGRVRERTARAAERARRRAEEITIVAVSKTFPAAAIREAYAAGIRHFGENRVQEWEEKHPLLGDLAATWHLVGHLQTNKAKRAARFFHTVDSLDSPELARKLEAAVAEAASIASLAGMKEQTSRLQVLIEVRLGPEETKTGVSETDLYYLVEEVFSLPHLDLRGLMTIPPFFDEPERVRPFFRKLCKLRDGLSRSLGRPLPELSMGMSHDFEIAIEEGATQVRIGTAIFGARQAV